MFQKVNPPGWAVGSVFSSSQANQIDANLAIALDKSPAGDQLDGVVVVGATGQIVAASPGAQASILVSGLAGITVTGEEGILSTHPVGGIGLAGGGADEILYEPVRGKTQAMAMLALNGLGTDWAGGSGDGGTPYLYGPGPSSAGAMQTVGPLLVHQAATLTNVRVVIAPTTGHSGIPGQMPIVQVMRFDCTTNTLLQIATFSPTTGSGGAWDATTHFDVPVTSNNVIDRTRYTYYLIVQDESGANAKVGGAYQGLILTFTNIGDMRFA